MDGILKLNAAAFSGMMKIVNEEYTLISDELSLIKGIEDELCNSWEGDAKNQWDSVFREEMKNLNESIFRLIEIVQGIDEMARNLVIVKESVEDLISIGLRF